MHEGGVSLQASHVCDGDIWVIYCEVRVRSVVFWPTLKDYECAANKIRTLQTDKCDRHGKRVSASRKLGGERKLLNGFVLVRDDGDKVGEIRVARVLLFYLCFLKENREGAELALLLYLKLVPLWVRRIRH